MAAGVPGAAGPAQLMFEELAEAVRRVHQGLRVVDPELAAEAWGEPDPLTDRERQVLRLAGDGMASGDIAASLNLSEGTVRNYLSEAISKLGAALPGSWPGRNAPTTWQLMHCRSLNSFSASCACCPVSWSASAVR